MSSSHHKRMISRPTHQTALLDRVVAELSPAAPEAQSICARAGGRHAPLADDGPRPLFETGAAGHVPNLPTHTDSSGHVLEHCTTPFALHLWTKPGRITPAGTGPLRGSASGSTALVAAAARSVGGHVAGHGEQRGEGQAERHTTAMIAACVDTLCPRRHTRPGSNTAGV